MTKNNNDDSCDNQSSTSSSLSESCDGINVNVFREMSIPPENESLAYKVCMDKPNFNIINQYFSSILEARTINLPNAITLTSNHRFEIIIRIKRQILSCKQGFEIPIDIISDDNRVRYFENGRAMVKLNSSSGIYSLNPILIVNNRFPGYVEFIIRIRNLEMDAIDLCSIDYSFIFDTFKLNTLYTGCCKEHKRKHKCRRPDSVIKLETETAIVITTVPI